MPKTAQQKFALVRTIETMIASGLSQNEACAGCNVPAATFVRWRNALASGGAEALVNRKPTGRPRSFEPTEDELNALRSHTLKFDSAHYAIERFVNDPACQPETRAKIHQILDRAAQAGRQPHWPLSLRRAAFVTERERELLRGPKHAQATEFSPRKGMFHELADRSVVPIISHTVWQMDDYSTNQPYIVMGEDGKERVARQYLCAVDTYSAAWLSAEAIGRERDAYRGEDILRFMLRTIDGQGTMPHFLLLERGRWESAAIHGLDLGGGHTWGAITDLIDVEHGYTSRHKGLLESKLNLLQRALAHTGIEIGRNPSEFEAATKAMLRVQAGTLDPRTAGFLDQAESLAAHWETMQLLNSRSMQRVNFPGAAPVPNDLLQLAEKPNPLPDDERWRFFPMKMRGTVRGGFVEKDLVNWPKSFRFQVNGVMDGLYLDNGYKILIAFDPAQPQLGAMIANGETGAKNRDAWPLGHPLLMAPMEIEAPQFSLATGGYKSSAKRKANATARTSFAAINPHRRGLTVEAQLGGPEGTVIIQRGMAPASDVAPAALRPGGGRRLAASSPPPGRLSGTALVPGLRMPSRLELLAQCAALEAD